VHQIHPSPYLTLADDVYRMSVGARPLGQERLIEVDHRHYLAELAQKRAILADDLRYYVQSLPGSEPAEWEALAAILTSLARDEPACFTLTCGERWEWENRLTGERLSFRYGHRADLPAAPLDWAGRQVQEDLLLLSGDADAGFPLIAGQLCFANRWCLDDKIGQPYLAIHAPVPGFAEQVGRSSSMLLDRLKQERPVWRLNWSVLATGELNRATRFGHELDGDREGVTPENAGDRCFFRTERQTLSRMPQSGAILFTVHTYIAPIAQLAADAAWRAKMIGVLRTTPPEMLAYKGMAIFSAALLSYLEQDQARERAVGA
jgi:dimethylamine monooxygenase subunit A